MISVTATGKRNRSSTTGGKNTDDTDDDAGLRLIGLSKMPEHKRARLTEQLKRNDEQQFQF